ncbi:MAG: repeat containing protein [Mucilaginibacter sp.]|nr:repeat containing protein [Mucilaginibacter sp.]
MILARPDILGTFERVLDPLIIDDIFYRICLNYALFWKWVWPICYFNCRPVINGKNVYSAVFRSENNQNLRSGYITTIDENNRVVSTPGGTEPVYINDILQPQKQDGSTFIHPHDVCIDMDENLYIPQWNSDKTYPLMLERI